MAEQMTVSAPERERGSYKKLHHLEIEKVKGANGGHLVRHHFQSSDGFYHEPQTHLFGKGDGEQLISHLRQHLGIHGEPEDAPEEAEPKEE